MPLLRSDLHFCRRFNVEETTRLLAGFIALGMEDKWNIRFEDNELRFYRSWTGYLIYSVLLSRDEGQATAYGAMVNRDPLQYTETDDDRDLELLNYLLDRLLLGKPVRASGNCGSTFESFIEAWAVAGRGSV